MLGALILQQTFDLTDEQTVEQFCFNTQWHFALNITEESDAAKYLSGKTLWNNRNIVATNNLEDDIFSIGTQQLAQVFKVDLEKQRIDSVHIKSNMRRLGRIGIFCESIHTFLVNLKRGHQNWFTTVDENILDRYLTKDALGCFARVKPSESRKTLVEVEPAHNSDANVLVPAIEATEEQNLKPQELIADSLYGSDDSCEYAKEHEVELIAPAMGAVDQDKLSLADFQLSEKGQIMACPSGHAPAKVKKRKKTSIGFASQYCDNCPHRSSKEQWTLNFVYYCAMIRSSA
jgi:hypothetical protein